jgi:hypothetical protein
VSATYPYIYCLVVPLCLGLNCGSGETACWDPSSESRSCWFLASLLSCGSYTRCSSLGLFMRGIRYSTFDVVYICRPPWFCADMPIIYLQYDKQDAYYEGILFLKILPLQRLPGGNPLKITDDILWSLTYDTLCV